MKEWAHLGKISLFFNEVSFVARHYSKRCFSKLISCRAPKNVKNMRIQAKDCYLQELASKQKAKKGMKSYKKGGISEGEKVKSRIYYIGKQIKDKREGGKKGHYKN